MSTPASRSGARIRVGRAAAWALVLLAARTGAADPDTPWQLAGRMGSAQFIIVPEAQARDPAYYARVIAQACPKGESCFLRFFTNSHDLPLGLPLADPIYAEQTAMFSRSMKAQREVFEFSCRMGLPEECF